MNPPTADPQEQGNYLATALRLTKRRVKSIWIYVALGAWLAGTIGFITLFVVGDHWLPGGIPVLAGWAARTIYGLGALAWLALAAGLPLVRRVHDLYAARLIERANPEFRNTLIDAVQLARHAELPGSVRMAVVDAASDEVAEVDFLRSVPRRRLRKVGIINACLLALLALYGLFSPKSIIPSMARAFGARVPAPTWTRIEDATPADGMSVLRGQPVRFGARLAGRMPETAVIRFSLDGGVTWATGQELPLRPPPDVKNGTWQAVKAGQDVQRSMLWQVAAGDATTPLRRLEVRELPAITDVQLRLEPPAYTHIPPTTQPGGDIDALVGTRAVITATANVAARDPIMVTGTLPDERRRILPTPSAVRPREIVADLIVQSDDSYELRFRDVHGESNHDPIRYVIRARPDAPPRVKLTAPGPEVEAGPMDKLPLAGVAEDDFGLSRATLEIRVRGRSETRELPLSILPDADGRAGRLSGAIDVALAAVAPGDMIEWWVAVWDNRENADGKPAPQRTDSEVRRIVIPRPKVLLADRGKMPAGNVTKSLTTQPAVSNGQASRPPQPDTAPSNDQADAEAAKEKAATRPALADRTGERDDPKNVQEFARQHERELEKLAKHLRDSDAGPADNHRPEQTQNDHNQATTRPAQQGPDAAGDKVAASPGENKPAPNKTGSEATKADQQADGTRQPDADTGQESATQPADGTAQAENKSPAENSDNSGERKAPGTARAPEDATAQSKQGDRNPQARKGAQGNADNGKDRKDDVNQKDSGNPAKQDSRGPSDANEEENKPATPGPSTTAPADAAGSRAHQSTTRPADSSSTGKPTGVQPSRLGQVPDARSEEQKQPSEQQKPPAQQNGQPNDQAGQPAQPAERSDTSPDSPQNKPDERDNHPDKEQAQSGSPEQRPAPDTRPADSTAEVPGKAVTQPADSHDPPDQRKSTTQPADSAAGPTPPGGQMQPPDLTPDTQSGKHGRQSDQQGQPEQKKGQLPELADQPGERPDTSPRENNETEQPPHTTPDPTEKEKPDYRTPDSRPADPPKPTPTNPPQRPTDRQPDGGGPKPGTGTDQHGGAQSPEDHRQVQGENEQSDEDGDSTEPPRKEQQGGGSSDSKSGQEPKGGGKEGDEKGGQSPGEGAGQGQGRGQGQGQSPSKTGTPGVGQGGTQSQSGGQNPGKSEGQGQSESKGEGQGSSPGQKQGQGQGQGDKQGQGQGAGQGDPKGQGPGQGQGGGKPQTPNQSAGPAGGKAEGQGHGEGQGQSGSKGQAQGQGQGQGSNGQGQSQGQAQGDGQGSGQGQEKGKAEGQGKDGTKGEGGSNPHGQGNGPGVGQGQSATPGQSQGQDGNPGQAQGKPEDQKRAQGEAQGQSGGSPKEGQDGSAGQGQSQAQGQGKAKTGKDGQGEQQGESQDGGQGQGNPQGSPQQKPSEKSADKQDSQDSNAGHSNENGAGKDPKSQSGQAASPTDMSGKGGTGSPQGGQGGQSGGGTMPQVPDKPADPDRPIERPADPAKSDPPLSSTGRVERLMDELERDLRSGQVDESLLTDLGWTLSQAKQFVEAFKRAKAAGQRQQSQTQLPQQVQPAEATPKTGNGVLRSQGASPTAKTLKATHERAPDRTQELMEVGHQRVAPRYRSVLEGYYRSVGSRPAP